MQSVQCIRDWLARRSRESKRSTRHDARPTEAWRIDAYIMMMAAAAKAGWSEGFERLGGSLLGYEEWQTGLHLERLRAGPHAEKVLLAAKALEGGPPKNNRQEFSYGFRTKLLLIS